jgi:hypothetical protein
MKRFCLRASFLGLIVIGLVAVATAREVYTGTIVSYGTGLSTRMSTGTFTLTIDRYTADERAQRLLGMLQEGADDRLLSELDKEEVGRFEINGRIGPRLNVVRETMIDGRKRIFAVFRRWMNFGEIRAGSRSTDYPYGVIELYVDPKNGSGDGTFVAASRIRWHQVKSTNQYEVEIENFGTYPARLMGVRRRD